ncbi:uncharacterized protein LY89DRAFT_626304 [Mollisia scopiformis]|uniref:AMMECR1 domain-containing protein n=1 Tax=Mollisia scopiformis TaxID=149040 RepID=A0A194WT00_MOLSC|nr:uncharacterized protein LY89DRAFT_626304 [Mollisia scopiformis]KUJ10747.1 hypothetical protein LY89DRAFT_626304 [Mollisia scopiformis]
MATVEHCLYCFETLAARLEKRTPMTLYQVQSSWAAYPKEDSPPTTKPKLPALQRLSESRSSSTGSSTPSSSTSTTSLTPASSLSSFSPIGLHPRRTSQRSSTLTESPLFVTWNTLSSSSPHQKSLRGCIGTFTSTPLSAGLSSYALASAIQDDRFSPISLRELSSLEVSVTLLTDFETCPSPLDWEIGVHGIRISFYARNKRYGACYLPDVAVEQEWDKEETVVSAMRKAGWGGRREKWMEVGDLKVVRFQGVAESVGWGEFRRWREWVEKGKEEGK